MLYNVQFGVFKSATVVFTWSVVSRPCPGGERIMDVVLWVRQELELWLRPGCKRLPALTITRLTQYMEFIVS